MPPPTVEPPPLITGNSRGGNQSLTSLTPLSDAVVEHYNDKIVVGPNATADEKCRAAYRMKIRRMNGSSMTMTNPLSPFGSAMVERWNAAAPTVEAQPQPLPVRTSRTLEQRLERNELWRSGAETRAAEWEGIAVVTPTQQELPNVSANEVYRALYAPNRVNGLRGESWIDESIRRLESLGFSKLDAAEIFDLYFVQAWKIEDILSGDYEWRWCPRSLVQPPPRPPAEIEWPEELPRDVAATKELLERPEITQETIHRYNVDQLSRQIRIPTGIGLPALPTLPGPRNPLDALVKPGF